MLSADKKNGIMKAMETIIKKIDKNQIDEDAIREAGEILREGGLVAFPTETVYGLGANALDEEAAKKTYEAKGRPSDNPLIVHIADLEDLSEITENVPPETELLAKHFWPGPLTMIFEKSSLVPYGTTGGLDTVAVREPSDLIARKLILAGRRICIGAECQHIRTSQSYHGRACVGRSEREDRDDHRRRKCRYRTGVYDPGYDSFSADDLKTGCDHCRYAGRSDRRGERG